MPWSQICTPVAGSLWAFGPRRRLPGRAAARRPAFHVRAHVAALLGLAAALLVVVATFGMPAGMATMAAFYGACFGLLPIGWIILNAIFVYDISVKTGKFEAVKDTIANIAAGNGGSRSC